MYTDPDGLCWCHQCHKTIFLVCLQAWWWNSAEGGGGRTEICIVSNQDKWYLDHLDVPWQKFYMNEPLTNISTPEQQKLVIGGEVCMWGESIDASDIEQTIWPRAAAAAGNTGEN